MCLNVEELNPLFFLGGLGAFLIGHIFYVIGYCVSDSFFSKFLLGLPFYACKFSPDAHHQLAKK